MKTNTSLPWKPLPQFGGTLADRLARSPLAAEIQQRKTLDKMKRGAPSRPSRFTVA